jgi:hypothetical protein
LAIGRRKNAVKYSVSAPPETRNKEKTRATLRVFAMLSASQTKTQNIQTCFLAENTVQGSVFTPSDTKKTANQLAPVGLKGGSPKPQFDKPADTLKTLKGLKGPKGRKGLKGLEGLRGLESLHTNTLAHSRGRGRGRGRGWGGGGAN